MDTLESSDLARWCSGEWQKGTPSEILGLSNDTRSLVAGQLFAALRTERRDGHDYLQVAKSAGASGAVVDRFQSDIELPQLLVEDVGAALLAISRGYRKTWRGEVVGITGSCGKTTCKEILGCLLSKRKVLRTEGNLNNLIGVPMSILRPQGGDCEFAVLEAGISEPGEMRQLADTIDPDWAIVSAIGPAHLKDLGSVENVAREKGFLTRGQRIKGSFLGESCLPYLDMLEPKKGQLVKRDRHHSIEWAYDFESAGGRTQLRQRIGGSVQVFFFFCTGAGLASNAALSLALAFTMGIEIEDLREGLKRWKPGKMRNEWVQVGTYRAYVDCYNANPLSMADSLLTFTDSTPDTEARFYLIGCMEELGPEGPAFHRELGGKFSMGEGDFLLVIGEEAKSLLEGMKDAGCEMDRCFEIKQLEEAKAHLSGFQGNLFLKGSRRYHLESVLDYFPASDESGGVA